jgi:hypothetical protein
VTLRDIDAGAAISPRSLIFGPVEVDQMSPRQTVTLENCNPLPIRLAIEGVVASAGEAEAWDVSPAFDERTLGPRDKLQLSAAFRPRRAGRHGAPVQFAIDGAPGQIELSGDAIGARPVRPPWGSRAPRNVLQRDNLTFRSARSPRGRPMAGVLRLVRPLPPCAPLRGRRSLFRSRHRPRCRR